MDNDDSQFYLELLQAYFDSANDAIFVLCDEMKFLVCNRVTQDWFAASEAELTRHNQRVPLTHFFADADNRQLFRDAFSDALLGRSRRFDCRLSPRAGRELWVEMNISRVNVAAGDMVIVVARDISLRRQQQEALQHQATHDDLTGLPNRNMLQGALEKAVALAAGSSDGFALLVLDLDRFKEINNTLGHHVGDSLLRQVAVRLLDRVSLPAVLARRGGDEFAVLLPRADAVTAESFARDLLAAMDQPFDILPEAGIAQHSVSLSATIGIALYPEHGQDAVSLLQFADVAMYLAKHLHNGYAFYDPVHDRHSPERLALLGGLRRAIAGDELLLHYQPVVSMAGRRLHAVECLVRWQHPQRGLLYPDMFIPFAEQTGLIRSLDRWVITAALRQSAAWRSAGLHVPVSVNLSVGSLYDAGLAAWLLEQLGQHGLGPGHLALEVTESAMMTEPERSVAVLRQLAEAGIRIAIDDYGTGYSSLAYLKRLPLDRIKIDKSFVINMSENENDAVIVRSTVELAHNLGFEVVAEGVEDAGSWRFLEALRCNFAQGWHIARPMPADRLPAWLTAYSGDGNA